MAGVPFTVSYEGDQATDQGNTFQLTVIAASNHRFVVREIYVSCPGLTASVNTVSIVRNVTGGTFVSTNVEVSKLNPDDSETLQTTAERIDGDAAESGSSAVLLQQQVDSSRPLLYVADHPSKEIMVPGGDNLCVEGRTQQDAQFDINIFCEE